MVKPTNNTDANTPFNLLKTLGVYDEINDSFDEQKPTSHEFNAFEALDQIKGLLSMKKEEPNKIPDELKWSLPNMQ